MVARTGKLGCPGIVSMAISAVDIYSAVADDHVDYADPDRTDLPWAQPEGVLAELLGLVRRVPRLGRFRVVIFWRHRFLLETKLSSLAIAGC
jgi:hypothetical protein